MLFSCSRSIHGPGRPLTCSSRKGPRSLLCMLTPAAAICPYQSRAIEGQWLAPSSTPSATSLQCRRSIGRNGRPTDPPPVHASRSSNPFAQSSGAVKQRSKRSNWWNSEVPTCTHSLTWAHNDQTCTQCECTRSSVDRDARRRKDRAQDRSFTRRPGRNFDRCRKSHARQHRGRSGARRYLYGRFRQTAAYLEQRNAAVAVDAARLFEQSDRCVSCEPICRMAAELRRGKRCVFCSGLRAREGTRTS